VGSVETHEGVRHDVVSILLQPICRARRSSGGQFVKMRKDLNVWEFRTESKFRSGLPVPSNCLNSASPSDQGGHVILASPLLFDVLQISPSPRPAGSRSQ